MQEHMTFLDGLRQHGKGWKQIAVMIPSRSVVQIRTHAQKYFQKLCKAQQQAGGNASVVPEVVMDTRNGPFHGGGVLPGYGVGGATSTSTGGSGGAASTSGAVVPAAGWAALQAARAEGLKAPNRGSKQNNIRKGHRAAPPPALQVNTSNLSTSAAVAAGVGMRAYSGGVGAASTVPSSARGLSKARGRKAGQSSSTHRRLLAPAGVKSAVDSIEVVTKRSTSGQAAKKRRTTSSKKSALANSAAGAPPAFLQSPSPSSVVDPFFYGSSAMVASMDDNFFVENDGVSDALSEDLSEEEMNAMLALAAHDEYDDQGEGVDAAHVAERGDGKLPLPHRIKPQQQQQLQPSTSASRPGLGLNSQVPPSAAVAVANGNGEDEEVDDAFKWLMGDELTNNNNGDDGTVHAMSVTNNESVVERGSLVGSNAGNTSTSTVSAPAPSPCLALESTTINTSPPPRLTPSLSTSTVVGAPSLFSAQRTTSAPVVLPMALGSGSVAAASKDSACAVSMPRACHHTETTSTSIPVAPRPPSTGVLPPSTATTTTAAAAFAKNAAAWMAMKHIVPAPQVSAARSLAYPTAPYLKVTHPVPSPSASSTSATAALGSSATVQVPSSSWPRATTATAATHGPVNEGDTVLDALSLAVFEDVMPFEDGDSFESSLLVADPAL